MTGDTDVAILFELFIAKTRSIHNGVGNLIVLRVNKPEYFINSGGGNGTN